MSSSPSLRVRPAGGGDRLRSSRRLGGGRSLRGGLVAVADFRRRTHFADVAHRRSRAPLPRRHAAPRQGRARGRGDMRGRVRDHRHPPPPSRHRGAPPPGRKPPRDGGGSRPLWRGPLPRAERLSLAPNLFGQKRPLAARDALPLERHRGHFGEGDLAARPRFLFAPEVAQTRDGRGDNLAPLRIRGGVGEDRHGCHFAARVDEPLAALRRVS